MYHIASLYIGPAANPVKHTKELEFLEALQNSAAPKIKIILDENRALRPIPVSSTASNNNKRNKTTL